MREEGDGAENEEPEVKKGQGVVATSNRRA